MNKIGLKAYFLFALLFILRYNKKPEVTMGNSKYNRLIRDNKVEEILKDDELEMYDLTYYEYLNKPILEYLLEKHIHTKKMDNYSITNSKWIILYIKYNIIDPLVNANLFVLLTFENDVLLLDILLKVLDDKQRMKLYQNFKEQDYIFFAENESIVINSYKKVGITLPRYLIKIPTIEERKISAKKEIEDELKKLREVYKDISKDTLNTICNEFRKNAKYNHQVVMKNIKKLIEYKNRFKNFKIKLFYPDIDITEQTCGFSIESNNRKMVTEIYQLGTFTHELSHLLFNDCEKNWDYYYDQFKKLSKKINNKETINKIIDYLQIYHGNYDFMRNIFAELYYAKIAQTYGSYEKYIKYLTDDMINSGLDFLSYSDIFVQELIEDECAKYSRTMTRNYYRDEGYAESFINSILRGRINTNRKHFRYFCGHNPEYFEEDELNAFDESIAEFYSIINSFNANRIINDLRGVLGDEIIDLFLDYMNIYRGYTMKKKR